MVTPWKITENASTKTLVELFQNADAPKSEFDQAFIILTYRFRKEVLNKCEILCKKFRHDISTAEMIADRTFEAFARKGAFDVTKGNGKDYDESFLLYLLKIAEHELINYYRDVERKKNNPYDGSEQIHYDLPDLSDEKLDSLDMEARIEYNVISKLSRSRKAIYLTYKVYQRPGFKMTRKLLETLRRELGDISQNTVNVYLKEARDEVDRSINIYYLTEKIKKNGKGKK